MTDRPPPQAAQASCEGSAVGNRGARPTQRQFERYAEQAPQFASEPFGDPRAQIDLESPGPLGWLGKVDLRRSNPILLSGSPIGPKIVPMALVLERVSRPATLKIDLEGISSSEGRRSHYQSKLAFGEFSRTVLAPAQFVNRCEGATVMSGAIIPVLWPIAYKSGSIGLNPDQRNFNGLCDGACQMRAAATAG